MQQGLGAAFPCGAALLVKYAGIYYMGGKGFRNLATRLHILLTYNCSLRCKHCYVFSDQRAPGKISLSQVSHFLNDARKIGEFEWVYFSGGEPFTQYPLLLKAVQRARRLDFQVGVETNGFFARSVAAGVRMLRPLANLGVADLRISNDALHYHRPEKSPAYKALIAAEKLGIPTTLVETILPGAEELIPSVKSSSAHVEQQRFLFAGRAAEILADQFPAIGPESLGRCPRSDLTNPENLYIDTYGYVQVCPGLAIGNACQDKMSDILGSYQVQEHEILGAIEAEGPRGILEMANLPGNSRFVDACHACYLARKQLVDRHPDLLGPRLVYGF